MYIHAPTQTYPYTDTDLRRDNPQTSFPRELTDEVRAEFGMVAVTPTAQPTFDPLTHKLVEGDPVFYDGEYLQVWNVVALTAEEIAQAQQALISDITEQTQERLDSFARTRGYDNIVSACSYATSSHQKYGLEGRYCVTAREATWDTLFTMLAEVQAGTRPVPTGYADIEPELPVLAWPV